MNTFKLRLRDFSAAAPIALAALLAGCGGGGGGGGDAGSDTLNGTFAFSEARAFVTLLKDGHYIFGSHLNQASCGDSMGNGVQFGTYSWDRSKGDFKFDPATINSIADCGRSGGSGKLTVNSDGTLSFVGSDGTFTLTPVASTSASLIGSFQKGVGTTNSSGVATVNDTPNVLIFLDASHFFSMTTETNSNADTPGFPGVEDGCYSYDSDTKLFRGTISCNVASGIPGVDTNGTGEGPSDYRNTIMFVDPDTIQFVVNGLTNYARIPNQTD